MKAHICSHCNRVGFWYIDQVRPSVRELHRLDQDAKGQYVHILELVQGAWRVHGRWQW